MMPIEKIMQAAPVIPVLVIDDAAHAQAIARALVAGGLPVLEVTLRTDAALDAIVEMKKVPGAIVGAGTVVDVAGLESAIAAGAEFIVSPGLTDSLGKAAISRIALSPSMPSKWDVQVIDPPVSIALPSLSRASA